MTEQRLARWLRAPHDGAAIAVFRIALGLIVAVSAVRFLVHGWVDLFFVAPRFRFHYYGLGWLPAASPALLHGLFVAVAVLGLLVALGCFYRAALALLLPIFTYLQAYDVSNYLNHYYLVVLLLALLFVVPAARVWSVDAWRRPGPGFVPAWCTYLLRFQIGVVYVYAGLAKLGADWLLHAQPLNIWLYARTSLPGVPSAIAALFDQRFVAYAASWAGFLFDTTVVAFLLARRTRVYAYLVVVAFHTATFLLFPIGMFPFIMTAAALIFFDPAWPRRLLARLGRVAQVGAGAPPPVVVAPLRRWALGLAGAYVVLQVLVPLRAHAYGGNVLWHEQGMRFSWRVMAREKNGSVEFLVREKATGRERVVPAHQYLTPIQEREMAVQPDLILQLAHQIARDFAARGAGPVEVRADARASLNGRPAARLVDESVDLAAEQDGLGNKPWILPAPTTAPIHLKAALARGTR